jgi:hypothetical protein
MFSILYSFNLLGKIVRYDFHSGAQDTVALHEDVATCIEFSQMTGKEH